MTLKGPRQKTICSLGDLGPRPREDWLKLARKMEDALSGQHNLLDADAGELADSVTRVRARRPAGKLAHAAPLSSSPRQSGARLIKVDPSRVTTERHREAAPSISATSSGSGSNSTVFCRIASCPPRCAGSPA